jgi:hypothetical protein
MGLPRDSKVILRSLTKTLFLFLLVILLPTILFHLISVQWVFDCYGPMRIWFPIDILLMLMGVVGAVHLGCAEVTKISIYRGVISVACMFVVIFYMVRHYGPTSTYKNAYDRRISELLNNAQGDTLVEVGPLPQADLVVEGDIMNDANDDVNRDFKETYDLPFKVKKK